MQRSFLKALLCAAGAVVFAGVALAQDAVKIGVTQPLTGAFAADGNYVAQGAELAADAINKAAGVDGKRIQLVIEDNKSNPSEAAATAERLIVEDKFRSCLGRGARR
jgi:branched-chain amino acid transport system substrate-binding protein